MNVTDTQSVYSSTDVTTDVCDDIERMGTKTMKTMVEEMIMQNEFLAIEVNMLEKTWKRSDPNANDATGL